MTEVRLSDTVYVVVREEDGWRPFDFLALFKHREHADAWLREHGNSRMRVDAVQQRDAVIHPDERT